MSWTQPVCSECYAEKEPGREPYRMKPEFAEIVRCCFCGRETQEGIWYRADPRTVPYPYEEAEEE